MPMWTKRLAKPARAHTLPRKRSQDRSSCFMYSRIVIILKYIMKSKSPDGNNKRNHWVALALFVIAAGSTLFFVVPFGGVYTSPDENANAFFAHRVAETGMPSAAVEEDLHGGDLVHPRSTVIKDGRLLPIGFLGLPIVAGGLGQIVGDWSIPVLTSVLAGFGVMCFYLLYRRCFPGRSAVLAATFLCFHPAFWYLGNRTMLPNVGFVALLIIAAWFFVRATQDTRTWSFVLGGAVLGLALTFRTSEVLWIVPTLVFLGAVFRKRWRLSAWWRIGAGAIPVFLPILWYNHALFGHPFAFGYTPNIASETSNIVQALPGPIAIALPFGFDVGKSLLEFWRFFLLPFPLLTVLGIFGLCWAVASVVRTRTLTSYRPLAVTVGMGAIAALWLVFAYGSWKISDIDASFEGTLGSAYLRYWLPLSVLSIPLMVEAVSIIGRHVAFGTMRQSVAIIAIALYLTTSAGIVFGASNYSVPATQQALQEARTIARGSRSFLERDAVIIAGRSDKIFFPSYSVAVDPDFSKHETRLQFFQLLRRRPLYLFVNTLDILDRTTKSSMEQAGFRLTLIYEPTPTTALYVVQNQ